MKFNYSYKGEGRIITCLKCSKGIKPNGKVCKYCNGTGIITRKQNQN